MKECPIENATDVAIDLEKLYASFEAISKALCIRRPVAIRLVGSQEMVQLNSDFRKCPDDTDVLTFPSGLDDPLPLGDIAISVPYAISQACLRGVSIDNELTALVVHGCLHLIGYDDIEDRDLLAMQQKMNDVGQQIGVQIDGEWTSILHQEIENP
jgi:probable rRNA maturation factor